jgi:hypothetical protein
MHVLVQPESLLVKFLFTISQLFPGTRPDSVKKVPEGFADAGPGEGWFIELEKGDRICIAPDPNARGWLVSRVSVSPHPEKGRTVFYDVHTLTAANLDEVGPVIKELCQ